QDAGSYIVFFSSRRRHTRSKRDWSSDVCSSDLQTIQFLRGTPYIYQGEEIGMTNPNYTSIEEYNDIETHNNYQILLDKGVSEAEALEIIQAKSRDNGRTPVQWDDSDHAGFTTGNPWLNVAPNYKEVNATNELANGQIFSYYQELIKLRREYDVI